MTESSDPLQALRTPIDPVDPDPGFAAALRARVQRALLAPDGEPAMSVTDHGTTARTTTPQAAALRLSTLTPYLAVVDAERAIEFYATAFGAVPRGEPTVMPDGRIGHAELAFGDSVLMLADEYPEIGLAAPATRGGPTQSLRLEVADPDAVVDAAIAAGATLDRPVGDSPYGRGGVVIDPSGHRWMVSREAPAPRTGDLGYASIWTPDVAAADAFYRAVFGWEITATHDGRGRRITGRGMHLGMWGGVERPTLMPVWAVPDVEEVVAFVRAAGGTAEEPTDEPFGRAAECVDDQGLPFAVFTPPEGTGSGSGAARGEGDLDYYEFRTPDPTRTRAFYSTVLGWRFRPGNDPAYWHPESGGRMPEPSCGLRQGDTAAVVPWFLVADAADAAERVRAAGGTVGDPTGTRDGVLAECTDDQGTAFGLIQR
jgi:predicted enzyme related to lactoylglutathione lyase